MKRYALGTQNLPSVDANVEDDEFAKTPTGTQVRFDGNTHANGGIDVNLPIGTKIFSDKLKIGKMSLADRAAKRAKKEKTLTGLLEDNGQDLFLKSSLNRVVKQNQTEEDNDLLYQELVGGNPTQTAESYEGGTNNLGNNPLFEPQYLGQSPNILAGNANQVQLGAPLTGSNSTNALWNFTPSQPIMTPENAAMGVATSPSDEIDPNNTTGNIVGMAGSFINAFAPLMTTIFNKKASNPNVNRWADYGHDAMRINDAQLDANNFAQAENDIESSVARNTADASIVNSARSLNVQRAARAANDLGFDVNNTKANSQFAANRGKIMEDQAQRSLVIDRFKTMGEDQTDDENQRDVDNFYTNINRDLGNVGTNVQQAGRDLNQQQYNNDVMTLLGDLSKYGISYKRGKNGKLTQVIR